MDLLTSLSCRSTRGYLPSQVCPSMGHLGKVTFLWTSSSLCLKFSQSLAPCSCRKSHTLLLWSLLARETSSPQLLFGLLCTKASAVQRGSLMTGSGMRLLWKAQRLGPQGKRNAIMLFQRNPLPSGEKSVILSRKNGKRSHGPRWSFAFCALMLKWAKWPHSGPWLSEWS